MQIAPKVNIAIFSLRPKFLTELEMMLQGLGQNLILLSTWDSAYSVLQTTPLAAIVVDLRFWGKQQWEMLTQILSSHPETVQTIPWIAIATFKPTTAQLQQALQQGLSDYMLTPLVPQFLYSKLEVFVRLHHQTVQTVPACIPSPGMLSPPEPDSLLQLILAASIEASAIVNDQGELMTANPAACELLGVSRSELTHQNITTFFSHEFNVSQGWQQFLHLATPGKDYQICRGDGTHRDIKLTTKANVVPGLHLCVFQDITDRKQVMTVLQRQALMFETISDAVIVTDLQGKIVDWNQGAQKMFGYSKAEVLGKEPSFLHPDQQSSKITSNILKSLEIAKKWHSEISFVRKDETQGIAETIVVPMRDETGTTIATIGVNHDITERKKIETDLLKISKAVESTSDAICITDIRGKSIYHNQAFLHLFGYGTQQLNQEGGLIKIFAEPNTGREIISNLKQGLSWQGELVLNTNHQDSLNHKNNRRVLGFLRADAVQDLEGEIIGLIFICTNITSRQLEQTALWENQRLIHQIADTIPVFLYLYDIIEDRNIYANHRLQEFVGLSQTEIYQKGMDFFSEFIHEEDYPTWMIRKHQLEQLQDGEVLENEYRLRNRFGEWRWFHTWKVVFMRNADGKPEKLLGTAIDITEHKQAEVIKRALEREQEFSRLQLHFFSMISHEFRTPLSSILMSAQILENSSEPWISSKVTRNLIRIQDSVKHMMNLLEDILTINRAEAGRLEFHPQPLDVERLCEQLVEEMRLKAGDRTFVFSSRITYPFPNLDEKIIRIILTNCLENAINFSGDNSQILFTVHSDSTQVIFKVKDEGQGIIPETQNHIFEPFYRGENVTGVPGSGLGLTLVKKCVDLCQGQIEINSQIDVGTTFTITLPLA